VATIIIQLDPAKLDNPDLDIRYVLSDLLVERSNARMKDEGFDYAGEGANSFLLVFLSTDDPDDLVPVVVEVLKSERVLENDLSTVPIAVQDGTQFRVVHPPNFLGVFQRPRDR
jgi:hypothetical protein